MKSMFSLITSFLLIICLAGCTKKQSSSVGDERVVQQCEARFFDMPIPLSAHHKQASCEQGNLYFRYKTADSVQQLALFYIQEMDLCGWRHLHTLQAPESSIVFEKPHGLCAISLRPQKKGTLVVIALWKHA